ncbi:kinase-like domain-containing protein [Tanacetum coccineum]
MKSPQAIIHLSSSSRIPFLFYGLAITCLTSATVSASYAGNETDYLALLSFKSMITHDPYKVLASWNHSFHFCEWSGISCGKRHKRVTVLRLSGGVGCVVVVITVGISGYQTPSDGCIADIRNGLRTAPWFRCRKPELPRSDPQTEVAKLSRLPKPPRQTLTPPQSNTHLDDFEDSDIN